MMFSGIPGHPTGNFKAKKAFMEEIDRLHVDLQWATDDRDQQAAQVQTLTFEVVKYKECTGKSVAELEQLATKTTALEVILWGALMINLKINDIKFQKFTNVLFNSFLRNNIIS